MRSIGLDVGKISFKAVMLLGKEIKEIFWKAHNGEIEETWKELKERWQIEEKDKVLVTGRFRDMLPYPSVPERVAQEQAARFLYPEKEVTLIRLGGGGFSMLKTRSGRQSEYRQNPRCAAGTGAFLDQILNRVALTTFQVDEILSNVKGMKITSRCGVTMKSDFTHLLNVGNKKEEVVAGLLDSSARNAVALVAKSPTTKKEGAIGGLSVCQRIVQTIGQELNGAAVEVPTQALYLEALGAALIATEEKLPKIKKATVSSPLVFLPALKEYLSQVTKIELPAVQISSAENLVMGLDIGSTGSKLVIFGEFPIFEVYCETKGQPVQAAKNLVQKVPVGFLSQIKAAGITGSGREIVGPLLRASLPESNHQQIFVLNEIAAHARGAVYYDPGVDTVVDIGGQDAKFIKLEEGRVVDNAMNTVCSAGTGSFLAEQVQLLGIEDVKQLGEIALASPRAADLGQHCAVFISEQIDEAKCKSATIEEIVAGLYYSVVRNYNNRVKGLRDYGQKIFLQGKPAENLALACALTKVTGQPIILPPSPGSVGALGIALLAKKDVTNLEEKPVLNFDQFLHAQVVSKKEFQCQSKEGCVEGNQCLIQVIEVEIGEQKIKFFWGGACDKYEKTGKNLALAKAPQSFLERERLISKLIIKDAPFSTKTVGIPCGLETEEILPLVITFFQELGLKVKLLEKSGLNSLEKGAKLCQATFCAPLQLFAGEAKELENQDFLFLPKVIEISGKEEEKKCYVCPLSQAMPDMLGPKLSGRILKPFLNFKEGYEKNLKEFLFLGLKLGVMPWKSYLAFKKAVKAQKEFETDCQKIGQEAIEFAKRNQIPVIVVLGHPYIIHSSLLNAGIPETIQEKGAIALPADCYPLQGIAPKLQDIYWGYGHRLLDVAYETRRQSGVFPLWLSVYSCGPDSFLIHFFQYLSQGKPYTILESDAYTGQAGFKTRIEAFLYSIKNYQPVDELRSSSPTELPVMEAKVKMRTKSSSPFANARVKEEKNLPDLSRFEIKGEILGQTEGRKVLIPWMGEGSKITPALLEAGLGIEAEYLPMADEEALELGRQCTSGKECLPMIITVGTLRKRVENSQGKFAYFMPLAYGPCRFGQYHLLTQIILEKLGLSERVKVISPSSETGYRLSAQFGPAMRAKTWATFVFVDLLKDALLEKRPGEKISGESERIFNFYLEQAEKTILENPNDWSGFGNLWGMANLAKIAVEEFRKISQIKNERKPKILVTGEIFVRLDEFSNNFVVRELEALGAKVKLAPFREWINYTTFQRRKRLTAVKQKIWKVYLTWFIQNLIEDKLYDIFAAALDWPLDHSIEEIVKAAEPYLSKLQPLGESALTIGLPLLLWKKKEIDGVVLVGPFECMPTRIAETQLSLVSEQTGLPVLSLSFYGDPIDKELLESFVWDLKSR